MGVWYGGNTRYSETAEQSEPLRTCQHCGLTMPLSQFPMHPKPSGGWSYSKACGACEQAAREEAERREEIKRRFKTREVCRAQARAKARQKLYEKGGENER